MVQTAAATISQKELIMNKLIYTDDQDKLLERCGGVMWTLIESDRHIKQASSDAITEKLIRDHLPDKKHFAIHCIAMGAGEDYGQNKNFDYFSRQALRDNHHTFVKNGHYFEEHRNRDPKKKIGDIVASAFNEPMKRVELVIHGDKEKAAKQYEKAKQGKDLDGSMSCKIAFDICNCCGNKAKSSKNYCVDLKRYPNQYREKYGKFAYAINPDPKFFDFSDVENRADRTAKHLEFRFHSDDEMSKAAGVNEFVFSDELATEAGILLPEPIHQGCLDPGKQAWLTKLASMEEYINRVLYDADNVAKDNKFEFVKYASPHAFVDDETTEEQLLELRKITPGILFRHLAKQAAVMPFPIFAAYVNNQTIKAAGEDPMVQHAQRKVLPAMFQDALTSQSDSKLEDMFDAASHYKAASLTASDDQLFKAANSIYKNNSLVPRAWRQRVLEGSVDNSNRDFTTKSASTTISDADKLKAKNLVQAYAMYKVAFCQAVTNLLGESFIDEPTLILLTSQNRN